MKGKVLIIILALLLLLVVGGPLTVFAVSYPPAHFKPNDIVYMFHSGTNDVMSVIHPNDILIVYRTDSSCAVKEVGKIRVISFAGETYLKGEIIEGLIEPYDIAKKGKVSCLILSEPPCNHSY